MRNPVFSNIRTIDGNEAYDERECASYGGMVAKTFILLFITAIVGAAVGIALRVAINTENTDALRTYIIVTVAGAILSFICVLVGRLSCRAAKYCSVIYAASEGVLLGGVTSICELYVHGIGTIAVVSTVIIFAIMLVMFASGLLRRGAVLRGILIGVALGLLVLVTLDFVLLICGTYATEEYYWVLYLIQGFLLLYGAVTLAFNFMEAEDLVNMHMPKETEWSFALGMEVSLVYIYVEVLRLVMLFAGNRRN